MKHEATGDCYAAAGRLLAELSIRGSEINGMAVNDAQVIHAVVHGSGPLDGLAIGHAWVEANHAETGIRLAFDFSNNREVVLPAVLYRSAAGVLEEHRYDRKATAVLSVKSGHWGPWRGMFANADRSYCPLEKAKGESNEWQ